MKDRQPWSVRGVSREARAKAARAAAHRHMTIGEWVTQVLVAAADRDLGTATDEPAPSEPSGGSNLPATNSGTERELAQALGALVQHLQKNAEDAPVGDIVRRMERTEHALVGRMEQMAAGLYSVMQTMETRAMPIIDGDQPAGARPKGAPPIMLPDQSRLADAVERVVDAEARRQDQMAAVADALTMLAAKVDSGDSGSGSATTPEPADEPVDEAETKASDDEASPAEEIDETVPAAANDTEPHDERAFDDDGEAVTETADEASGESESDDEESTSDASQVDDDIEPVAAETKTPPPPAASSYTGTRDEHGNDVIAAIRARSARPPEFAETAEEPRRGLLGRLFRRDS
ncbi:MAG: hypothetical protein AAF563_22585 [Pseudomonadota bacterium]